MIQEIIALVAVVAALIYTAIGIVDIFSSKNETACNCGGCDIKTKIGDLKSLKKM
jgi:hypothetical protein